MKLYNAYVSFLSETKEFPVVEISSNLDKEFHLDVVISLYSLALNGFNIRYKFNSLMEENTYIIKYDEN